MATDTVRLTVQIRDHSNHTRLTRHDDVPLAQVEERASKTAARLARFFKDGHKAMAANKNGH